MDQATSTIKDLVVASDWRAYFYRHPWKLMGAALGGGLLLSALLIPRRR
jgi:ElaB/YqjD/DUF883 family membrane-anchored ribosome-binding protein